MCNDKNSKTYLSCPAEGEPSKSKKSILVIYNNDTLENETGNKTCYGNFQKSKVSCLGEKYSAVVILDGIENKQNTNHRPNFYIWPWDKIDLPIVTISYLDQEKTPSLKDITKSGIIGSVLINNIDQILEAKNMFDFPCDTSKCNRFELPCFVKT